MSAPTTTTLLTAWMEARRTDVEAALERILARHAGTGPSHWPAVVHEAMRYSLLAGGKRLRPMLTLAAAEAVASLNANRSANAETTSREAKSRAADSRETESREAEAHRLALPAACAIEMIHTYSLIHDDLPAMDDDSLRRGQPTSHVRFGEGMAILAGDGLLTEAFTLLAREPDTMTTTAKDIGLRKLRTIEVIAEAAGAAGMVGGQAIDLHAARPHHYEPTAPANHSAGRSVSAPSASGPSDDTLTTGADTHRDSPAVGAHGEAVGDSPESARAAAPGQASEAVRNRASGAAREIVTLMDAEALRNMHARKTGALIRAATVAGAVMAGASRETEAAVAAFATDLGLAFQIVDDVLDVEGTAADLGKTAGKDAAAGKPTYPALFGLDRSKQLAREAVDRARAALASGGLRGRLTDIAEWVVERKH